MHGPGWSNEPAIADVAWCNHVIKVMAEIMKPFISKDGRGHCPHHVIGGQRVAIVLSDDVRAHVCGAIKERFHFIPVEKALEGRDGQHIGWYIITEPAYNRHRPFQFQQADPEAEIAGCS